MSLMEQEMKCDLSTVEDFLLNYDDWVRYYEQAKANHAGARGSILHSTPRRNAGDPQPGRSSTRRVSNPTLAKVLRLLALGDLSETEAWLQLVQDVEAALPWKMGIFLRLRREYRDRRGPHGWTAAVQHRYAQEVGARLGKPVEDTWIEDRNTFTDWWNRILRYAAIKAAKRGLLNYEDCDI